MSTIQFKADGWTFTTLGQLETTTCGVCGVPFAAPVELLRWSREKPHRTFYCPVGHDLHFPGKTEAEKLREQLDRERGYSATVIARLDQTQASLSATKGVVTKLRKRASAGTCPCCNRTFQQLARHMESKHPGFVERELGHLPVDPSLPESCAPSLPERSGELARDILRILRDQGTASPAKLVEALGYSTANSVGVTLHRLRGDGLVRRLGYGKWEIKS